MMIYDDLCILMLAKLVNVTSMIFNVTISNLVSTWKAIVS